MVRVNYTIYGKSAEATERAKEMKVLLLDNDVQQDVLTMEDCIQILEDSTRGEGLGTSTNRTKIGIEMPTGQTGGHLDYVSMEGGINQLGVAAIRIRSHVSLPGGYDRMQMDKGLRFSGVPGKNGGIVLLFSAETGGLLAILNDGHIQHMRVGATSAIMTKYLAREDAQVLGILGSGGMATTHAWAISTVRPLRQIKVYSPNPDHRQRFARQMSEDLDLEVVAVDSAEAAVRGSDMVASCTDPVGPIIPGEWLEPGMHIASVSTTGHDLDDDACRRLNRYVVYRSGPAQYYHTTPPDFRPISGSSPQAVERERARVGGGEDRHTTAGAAGRSCPARKRLRDHLLLQRGDRRAVRSPRVPRLQGSQGTRPGRRASPGLVPSGYQELRGIRSDTDNDARWPRRLVSARTVPAR